MPRPLRAVSETGIYHVMSRGNRRKIIFHDREDKQRFINIMINKKMNGSFSLYGYCIMDNHYHLLIKEEKEGLATIMKMINAAYAVYYNDRYEGVGHVFQDRYRSEAINNDSYLLGVIRYIHNNPIKAGIEKRIQDYPWSSYQQYFNYKKDNELVNISFILSLFSEDLNKSIIKFAEFNNLENRDIYLEDYCEKEEEDKVRNYIQNILIENEISMEDLINDLKNLSLRNSVIKNIKSITMLPYTNISKIMEISRSVISRVK